MSGIFQGYANSDGRVRASQVTEVPAGSANDRGMVVAGNRVIPYLVDAGQPRTFHDGIAFDNVTGLLLVGDGTATPLNTSMGGLLVDVNGAVVAEAVAPDVIHQGVGLGNDGRLAIEAEPIATFIAHLRNNVASTTGPGTFTRASDGLYPGADGNWRVASDNVPRFENGQLLMEPAITNKCENFNANPDAALTGLSVVGDPAGVLRRVTDVEGLSAAGLDAICPSGHVFELDNSAGPTQIDVVVSGQTGNLNKHTVSCWAEKVSGANSALLRINTGVFSVEITSTSYERISASGTPSVTDNRLMITANAGVVVRFVLNQLEESPVLTSPIITQGAAAVRAADLLTYADPVNFFNQSQGMLIVDVAFMFNSTVGNVSGFTENVIALRDSQFSLLFFRSSNYRSQMQSAINAFFTHNIWNVGQIFRVALRWNQSTPAFQMGLRNGGSWTWGASVTTGLSDFEISGPMRICYQNVAPFRVSGLFLYDEDKGQQWIEDNLS